MTSLPSLYHCPHFVSPPLLCLIALLPVLVLVQAGIAAPALVGAEVAEGGAPRSVVVHESGGAGQGSRGSKTGKTKSMTRGNQSVDERCLLFVVVSKF